MLSQQKLCARGYILLIDFLVYWDQAVQMLKQHRQEQDRLQGPECDWCLHWQRNLQLGLHELVLWLLRLWGTSQKVHRWFVVLESRQSCYQIYQFLHLKVGSSDVGCSFITWLDRYSPIRCSFKLQRIWGFIHWQHRVYNCNIYSVWLKIRHFPKSQLLYSSYAWWHWRSPTITLRFWFCHCHIHSQKYFHLSSAKPHIPNKEHDNQEVSTQSLIEYLWAFELSKR